jgi:LPS-assembly lipoprotein
MQVHSKLWHAAIDLDSEAWERSKRTMRILSTLVLSFGLGACGFSPMYGSNGFSASDSVVARLSQVNIRPIAERRGMVLRQQLNEKLRPSGVSSNRYELQVSLSSETQELGVRQDSTRSRANLILTANYTLWDGSTRVTRDRARAVASYNILDDQYATITSERNAEARALRQISDEIRTRLAVHFERSSTVQMRGP